MCACVVTSSRAADDTDYDEHLTDDAGNDVINDVSAGRLMTCIGLNEMPHTVPPGERARWSFLLTFSLSVRLYVDPLVRFMDGEQ